MGPYAPEMKRVFGPRNGHWLKIPEVLAELISILRLIISSFVHVELASLADILHNNFTCEQLADICISRVSMELKRTCGINYGPLDRNRIDRIVRLESSY